MSPTLEKILLGLTSKRPDEEWEFFKNRTIEMFRQKGQFKTRRPASRQPPHGTPNPQPKVDPVTCKIEKLVIKAIAAEYLGEIETIEPRWRPPVEPNEIFPKISQ